jgi:DNA polymerase III alpha subunit (gram-positive type)
MTVTTITPRAPKYLERAMCPQCQRLMLIVRSQRLGLGYDMRTFECPQCKREEAAVVKYQ